MAEIGLRELKARASEVLREVKERGRRYVVTHRGRPVALITPLQEPAAPAEDEGAAWEELTQLGREIAACWQFDRSSTDLLSDMRR